MMKYASIKRIIAEWFGVSTAAVENVEEESEYTSGYSKVVVYKATVTHDRNTISMAHYHIKNEEIMYYVEPIDCVEK